MDKQVGKASCSGCYSASTISRLIVWALITSIITFFVMFLFGLFIPSGDYSPIFFELTGVSVFMSLSIVCGVFAKDRLPGILEDKDRYINDSIFNLLMILQIGFFIAGIVMVAYIILDVFSHCDGFSYP